MKLASRDRREAKQELKKLYLEEFKKRTDYSKDELKEFGKAVKAINRALVR